MKSFALGLLVGLVIAGAWAGRYQVALTSSSTAAGTAWVMRLDRWTGKIDGCALSSFMGPAWGSVSD